MIKYKKIGVVAISRKYTADDFDDFSNLYQMIGANSGNLMFTNACFSIFDSEVEVSGVGFSFDPDDVNRNYDLLIIPGANWINSYSDWGWLVKKLEQITIPLIVLGLGLQSETEDVDKVVVNQSSKDLMNLFKQKAEGIFVRGEFTRKWMELNSYSDAVVIGCPSLYMSFPISYKRDKFGVCFQSTRHRSSYSFNRGFGLNQDIFKLASSIKSNIIYQSEYEEMSILFGDDVVAEDEEKMADLCSLYGVNDFSSLKNFINSFGHAFYDLYEWSDFLQGTYGLIGSRLHGAILALNSNVPALLIPHDSRTAELARFAEIPTLSAADLRDIKSTEDVICLLDESADLFELYITNREEKLSVFRGLMSDCGLSVSNQPTYRVP